MGGIGLLCVFSDDALFMILDEPTAALYVNKLESLYSII